MKCVVIVLFILMMSGVFAMSEPIRVQAGEGNEVKVYIWPKEYGPILNLDNGIVGDDGFFETTFFSLNVENFRLHVMVIDEAKEKIRDSKFLNMKTDEAIFVDCLPSECVIGVFDVEENISEVVENESVIVIEDEVRDEGNILAYLTGKVVNAKNNFGYWWYSMMGVVVFLFIFVIAFMMMKRSPKEEENVMSEDDKKLEYMEKRVKETEAKIGKLKSEKEKKARIEAAKAKLAREEEELRELEEKEESDEESIIDIKED